MPDSSIHAMLGKSRSMTKSVTTATFGGYTYVFYYSNSMLYYAKAPINRDTKPYKSTPITYITTSCENGADDTESGILATVTANDLGMNPLAAATWQPDGNLVIASYSVLAALPGSDARGDYPKIYYTASNTDKVNEAYYKNARWCNSEIRSS
ncbi:hypothetical protein F4777DRAFT_573175 [Nemania sp. FL0916]|nr:hypothetical protein F4777DRAFT_573175 [Nemania sp. FL0916]